MSEIHTAQHGCKHHPEIILTAVESSADARRDFMLTVVRATRARAQSLVLEIDEIGTALKHNMITAEAAASWLDYCGATYFAPTEIDGGLIRIDEVAAQ
jgi:hypothetical protein